ncbi:MAG: hypothetical protein RM021_010705 [Nostoc sp. EkiNYC01]|nr:hypothetical protein [Nostoc sp. EkiNYC01]
MDNKTVNWRSQAAGSAKDIGVDKEVIPICNGLRPATLTQLFES